MSAPTGTSIGAGNPINLASGNKYQQEVDLPALPGELGLEIVRHYNSASRELGWIGRNWRLSYDTRLTLLGSTVQVMQADGRRLMFDRDPAHPGLCVSRNPDLGEVHVDTPQSGARYRWIWPNGRILHFDEAGLLDAIEAPSGARLTLWRGPRGELLKVRDPQGRELAFVYDRDAARGWGGVRAIQSPIGTFRYEHATDGTIAGNLLGVQQPGSQSGRRYHYAAQTGEAAPSDGARAAPPADDTALRNAGGHLLTGISAWSRDTAGLERSRRLSRYGYDAQGRAIESQRLDDRGAVVEGVRIDYRRSGLFAAEKGARSNSAPAPGYTVVTDQRGRRTEFLHGVAGDQHALYAVRGDGCAGCPDPGLEFAYTARGQLAGYLEQRPGQDGLLTRFERDRQGRVVRVWQQEVAARPQGVERIRLQGAPRWRVRYDYRESARQPQRMARPSVVEGREHSLVIRYDDRGQVVELTETGWQPGGVDAGPRPLERTTRYRYRSIDGVSRLVAVDGPLPGEEDTVHFDHDGQGRLVRVRHPVPGVQESYDYDAAGRATVHVPLDAVPVLTEFDASGQPVQWRRGDVKVTIRRDSWGRPVQWGRNDGRRLSLEYDDRGAVAALVDSDGSRQEFERDADGRVLAVRGQDAAGQMPFEPRRFRYDALGRLVETDAGQRILYDGHGRMARVIDPLQREVRYAYDRLDRLTHIEQVGGPDAPARLLRTGWTGTAAEEAPRILTRLLYEGDDKMPHGLIAANGAKTIRVLDDFGRLLRVTSPDTGTAVARYDAADRMIEAIDADGRHTRFQRDAMGREIERRMTGARGEEEESVVFRYAGPRLVLRANRHQVDNYEWDEQGRLVHQVTRLSRFGGRTTTAFLPSFVTRYRYDDTGRVKEKHLPGGLVLLPVYDSGGRVSGIVLQTPDGRTQSLVEARLDGLRGLTELAFGNGTRTVYARDKRARLAGIATTRQATKVEGRLLYGQRIEYDAVDRIVSIERHGLIERYRYDGLDRVTETSTARGSERFEYDAVGNRTRWSTSLPLVGTLSRTSAVAAAVQSHEYVAHHAAGSNRLAAISTDDRQVTSEAATPWTYDAAGNPLSIPRPTGHRSYTYGADGRMHQVRVSHRGDERLLADYRYNAAGERVLKKSEEGTTYYLYAGQKIAAEADEQGTITAHYVYAGHLPIAKIETRTTSSTALAGWKDIRPPAWQRFLLWIRVLTSEGGAPSTTPAAASVRILALHADHLGTPQLATDADQQVVWQASYTVFGTATVDEDPDRDGTPTRVLLRFPGQYFDRETQTHYNYFRDYDPALGRYLQSDPIGLAGGFATYTYVASNPLVASDPLGLEWEAADGSFPIWADRIIIGQRVHAMFAQYVTTKLRPTSHLGEWQSNSTYEGTFGNRRPDAFNTASKELWELKPDSYREDTWRRSRAELQVADYLRQANRKQDPLNPAAKCGDWTTGDSSALLESGPTLGFIQVGVGAFRQVYQIDLVADLRPKSGLIFYAAILVENRMIELLEDVLRELGRKMWVIWPGGPSAPDPRQN